MQIRIYQDGTFESLSAAVKTELATLKADLKTITQVEGLRVKREAAKKAGNALKDKAFLAEIKKLKATLSSNRNSSVAIVREKIAKLSKATTAPKLTKGNKTGDPRRNPTRLKSAPKEQLAARQRKAVHAPKKPAEKEPAGNNSAVLKAAGVKLSALNAADKANVKKMAAMKDHQEIAEAVTLGEISPRGMGSSAAVRNAGKLIATHLKPEERATVDKISAQHEASLSKIRGTTGSPTRELKLNEKTQKKLNMTGIFDAHFYKPWTAVNLINGITSVK